MKIPKIKKIKTKVLLIFLVCVTLFMLIAMPVLEGTTFNTLHPFLVDHINMKLGNSAALMSNFLYYSNVTMRMRALSEEFSGAVNDFTTGRSNEKTFDMMMTKTVEPFESTIVASTTTDIITRSYPAIYVEGLGVYCDDLVNGAADKLMASDWFADYKSNRSDCLLYSPIIEADGNRYFCYVFSNQRQSDDSAVDQTPYYVFLFTDFNDILELCSDFIDLHISDYVFIGRDFDLVYQNSDGSELDLPWIQDHVIAADRQHYVVAFEDGEDAYFSVLVSSLSEGLRFVLHADNQDLRNLYNASFPPVILLTVFFVIVLMVVIMTVLSRIFKRLSELSGKMSVVRSGNYDVKIDDRSEDEIGQLATVFNDMTDKIKDNVNRLVEKEKREKLFQYNLMVSAIDPHFVYNTLNTATRLAELGRNQEVIEVNDALINCLKENMKTKSLQAFDTVENEKKALLQYIKIQNYLCDNTIELNFETTPENAGLMIPKFLLQPIVENSIIHGILMNVDENGSFIRGRIDIDIAKQGERIKISIRDNGVGMSQETLDTYFSPAQEIAFEENKHFDHIGALNIRTRLSFLYNDDYTLTAESEEGRGTTITIYIPSELPADEGM